MPLSSDIRPADVPKNDYYVHEPLPQPDYFRILAVEPAREDTDEIVWELRVARISSASYNALSYSWAMEDGEASFNRQIRIAGKLKNVTQNLFQGLRRIRSRDRPLHIWIDALCINQDDIPERNSQVKQMASIYRNAASVLIWLGEGRDETEDRLFGSILQRVERHRSRYWKSQLTYPTCGLVSLLGVDTCKCACKSGALKAEMFNEDHDCYVSWVEKFLVADAESHGSCAQALAALDAFVTRRYWSRRWTMQEMFHAKAQVWYWGPCVKRNPETTSDMWDSPWGLATICAELRGKLNQCKIPVTLKVPNETPTSGTIKGPIGLLPKTRSRDGLVDLPDALDRARGQQCSDPRDKIFSLVSMCRQKILPNYGLTLMQVNIMSTRALLENGMIRVWLQALYNRRFEEAKPFLNKCQPSWALDSDEIQMALGSDDPLALTVGVDQSLTCEVRCFGIFANTGFELVDIELCWSRPFNGCNIWQWDESSSTDRLKRIVLENTLSVRSDQPQCARFSKDSAFDDSAAGRRSLESLTGVRNAELGDALCALTQGPYNCTDTWVVLRCSQTDTSSYNVVGAIHPGDYHLRAGSQRLSDWFEASADQLNCKYSSRNSNINANIQCDIDIDSRVFLEKSFMLDEKEEVCMLDSVLPSVVTTIRIL